MPIFSPKRVVTNVPLKDESSARPCSVTIKEISVYLVELHVSAYARPSSGSRTVSET
jgi:hypothetical protein